MKIGIGSDHAGFQYKERIKEFLQKLGHEVQDFGTSRKRRWIIRCSSGRRPKPSPRVSANAASCWAVPATAKPWWRTGSKGPLCALLEC